MHDLIWLVPGDDALESTRPDKNWLVDIPRAVQPDDMSSRRLSDASAVVPLQTTQVAPECRLTAHLWGFGPGGRVPGGRKRGRAMPQPTGWRPDTCHTIGPVRVGTRAAIECRDGQGHLSACHTHAAQNRANRAARISGSQPGGRTCAQADGFQFLFRRIVDSL